MNFYTRTLILAAVLTTPSAFAGLLQARASQNLGLEEYNTSATAPFVTASTPPTPEGGYATATTSWTQIHAAAYGYGASHTKNLVGSSSGRTDYQLWDLATDTPLSSAEAAGITLDFRFELTGSFFTQPLVNGSEALINYDITVYSDLYDQKKGSVSKVVGNGFGDIILGDSTLLGNSTRQLSVQHRNDSGGRFDTYLLTLASTEGYADFMLTLKGIDFDVASLNSPVSALGVKLTETGQIFTVSQVPLPSSFYLFLSALGLIRLKLRKSIDA